MGGGGCGGWNGVSNVVFQQRGRWFAHRQLQLDRNQCGKSLVTNYLASAVCSFFLLLLCFNSAHCNILSFFPTEK